MTINDQIRDEKLRYDINREAAKISAKTIENQGEKQVEALNSLKPNSELAIEDSIHKSAFNNDEAKKEVDKIKEIEKN